MELGARRITLVEMFRIPSRRKTSCYGISKSVDGHESDLRCVEGGVLALRLPGDGVLVVPDLAVAGLQPLLHGLPLRGVQLVHQPRPLTLGHLAKLQHKELWDATVSRLEICTPLLFGNQPPMIGAPITMLEFPVIPYIYPLAHWILITSYF